MVVLMLSGAYNHELPKESIDTLIFTICDVSNTLPGVMEHETDAVYCLLGGNTIQMENKPCKRL